MSWGRAATKAASQPSGGRFHAFTGIAFGAQLLFGGWFLFHGLNYWLAFYPDTSIRAGPGLVPAIAESGLMAVVKALEIAIGFALLANRFAALAIVAAWPIALMIAFVTASHGKPFGMGVAVVIILLNTVMSLGHLDRYRPMLAVDPGLPGARGRQLPAGRHLMFALTGTAGAAAITYLSLALRH